MCIANKELFIYDEYTARDFLRAHGIDDYQHKEFCELLNFDYLNDIEEKYESLKYEFEGYEASLDAAQGVLNDLLILCGERIKSERTKAAKDAYRTIYDFIFKSEAI